MSLLTRRGLVQGTAVGLASLAFRVPAQASQNCNGVQCDSNIPTSQFPHVTQPPDSQWCWAATISMICQWYGHPISFPNIVQQTFGSLVNLPADPITLINSVNRSYVDDTGRPLTLNSAVWSVLNGVANVDNNMIIRELAANRPLVVCNMSHMMVLVGVSFPQGTSQINQAWVADPAFSGPVTTGIQGLQPLAPGFRYLFPTELIPAPMGGQLMFVAAVNVT